MTQMAPDKPVQPDKPKATEALAEWVEPSSKLDLMTLTTVMIQSGFFPNVQTVAQGVVKILAGRELGFGPVASLRHVYVHGGHIGIMAQLVATKIRQSGTYDYRVLRCDDEACEIAIIRRTPTGWEDLKPVISFTLEEAKRAKLVKQGGGWETFPSDMLFARAITRAQKRHCPDVFGQAVYDPSQLKEIPPDADADGAFSHLMPQEKSTAASPDLAPGSAAPASVPSSPVAGPGEATPPTEEERRDPESRGRKPAARQSTAQTPRAEEPRLPPPDDPGQATLFSPEHTVSFELNGMQYTTAGITKEQMLQCFALGPKADRVTGKKVAKRILEEEFKVGSRKDLTKDQADQYLARLKECAGEA